MRTFEPPLVFEEIGRVYDFTTRVLEALGMPQWRIQITEKPGPKDAYACIQPIDGKHIGELSLGPAWMTFDLKAIRIPVLLHEMLHLTHRQLTDTVTDDLHGYVGHRVYDDLHRRWENAIELWVDHMSQVMLGMMQDQVAAWASEIWGEDWEDHDQVRMPE